MNKGAMSQLTTTLNARWIQTCFSLKMWCRRSYCTLQRMGYIMTSKPTATCKSLMSVRICKNTHTHSLSLSLCVSLSLSRTNIPSAHMLITIINTKGQKTKDQAKGRKAHTDRH